MFVEFALISGSSAGVWDFQWVRFTEVRISRSVQIARVREVIRGTLQGVGEAWVPNDVNTVGRLGKLLLNVASAMRYASWNLAV